MIKNWNISAALEEAVRLHHQPMASAVIQTFCAIASLTNSACLKLGIGPERMPDLDLVQLDVTARLKIAPECLPLIVQTAEAKLAEEKELFNRA